MSLITPTVPAIAPCDDSTAQPVIRHLPALDGLRGLAVLMVLAHHSLPGRAPGSALEAVVFRIVGTGWTGVDLFFVLSGFLITGILLRSKSDPQYFRNFYMRRTLRIFPLYYAVLAFVFLVAPHLHLPWPDGMTKVSSHQAWFWLYGTNFMVLFGLPQGLLAHFWSLAVEEHFYLFWPLLLYLLSHRHLVGVCIAMIVIAPIVRTGIAVYAARCTGSVAHDLMVSIQTLTFCRMDSLAFGGLLAVLSQSVEAVNLNRLVRRAGLLAAAALMGLAAWRVMTFDTEGVYPRALLSNSDPLMLTIGLTLNGILATTLVVLCWPTNAANPANRFFQTGFLRWLGKYSYGIYVFHFPIVYVVLSDQRFLGLKIENALYHSLFAWCVRLFVLLAVSVIVSVISFEAFESRFIRLKRHFVATSGAIER